MSSAQAGAGQAGDARAAGAWLLVTTSYPLQGDGSEAAGAFVADLAAELARAAPVRVVAPGPAEACLGQRDGVEVWTFAGPGKPLSLLSVKRPADWPAILGTLRSMRRTVARAAAAGPVGQGLALWLLPSGWALRPVCRRLGVPYLVWALGSDVWTLGRLPLVRGLFARVARDARHCLADGIALARDAGRLAGRGFEFLPSARRRAPDEGAPPRRAAPYRLLFLGRWHPNKGTDLLLDALAGLDEADWARIERVDIAGGGPLEPLVRARCAALRGQGRPVHDGGFLDAAQATAAIRAADWLLLPSRIESIPLVLADALSQGRPVVASPVGDLPALVAGDAPCGVLAEAVDAAAFARALRAALHGDAAALHPGVAATAARFSLAAVAARLREAAGGH